MHDSPSADKSGLKMTRPLKPSLSEVRVRPKNLKLSERVFMKNKKNEKKKTEKQQTPEAEAASDAKLGKKLKVGNLGSDLARRFSPSGKGAWRPTKPGGRMKSGKPG